MTGKPPVAPRIPSLRALHGDADPDDYAWMRDHSAPAFGAYLAAERAYYDAHAARLADLAGRLSAESAARIGDRADESVAWPRAGYLYRTRTPAGRENAQLLRCPVGLEQEQLLLDENVIGAASGYVDVAVREPSPDGNLLAWSADTSGAEIYRLRIRDLRTGEDLPDEIERSYPGVAWSADSRYLFYLVPDEVNRPFQVWRHRVGTSAAGDALVYAEPDARFELTLHATRSGQFAVITSRSRDATEVRLIRLGDPLAGPVLVEPRRQRLEYYIDHAIPVENEGLGRIFIATDAGEPEFTLMRAPADAPGRANWAAVECAAIAPARSGTRLHAVDVLAGWLVLTLRRDGESLLAITDHDGGNVREVRAGVACGSIRVAHAEDYHAGSVIIAEESLIEPPAWYRLDLATGERTLLKRKEVAGYEPQRYLTERLFAPAADGTPIPVTLARASSVPLDGTAPCLLYGYGAYESCADPEFSVDLPSLLDRGVVYAVAHVRGGGEGGRAWWQQGRLRAKPVTFSDFIDVADWLAGDAGSAGAALVDGRRIVSRGLSAGGLLQGAVYSMRPDRWRAVVAEVPFVDVVTTMLDPAIPLTTTEWDEWGDPRNAEDYACMRSYSPYDNPPAWPRPPLLVTSAVADPRVGVHEPAKWVARLRATTPCVAAGQAGAAEPAGTHGRTDDAGDDAGLVLFRVELGAGAHGGPSGRFAQVGYESEVHAFVLSAMGLRA